MLRRLKLQGVGPAPEMSIEFGERLNVITGDNSLGKSFLLDVAWWALTRRWAGKPAVPRDARHATIEYDVRGATADRNLISEYRGQEWPVETGNGAKFKPGIVVYMRIDNGFSVWDPARNSTFPNSSYPAYQFDNREVWEGLNLNGVRVSDGLERDWVIWQKGQEPQFGLLERVLDRLSPPDIALRPGPPRRVFLREAFDRPTLQIGGQNVPVAIASAGIRRVLALAYLLVWAWHEHRVAAELAGTAADSRVVLLIDEPETHLHPSWQRRIIPAVMEAINELHDKHDSPTQVLMATHSPMVLASLEPIFDPERDALFHLKMGSAHAELEAEVWSKQGDAANWLVSETFGLQQARSVEAEQAIEAAEKFMRGEKTGLPTGLETRDEIDAALKRLLPGHDEFWARWIVDGLHAVL
jgi:hypothetical protein